VEYDLCVPEAQRVADLFGVIRDLETAKSYCDMHIAIDPTEPNLPAGEMMRREHTRQALCRAAIIAYGRAFNSGVREGVGTELVARLSPGAQRLHPTIKSLRDKWVAHAVNHFDDVRVHARVEQTSQGAFVVTSINVAAQMVGGFRQTWMMAFSGLCDELLHLIKNEFAEANRLLLLAIQHLPIEQIMARKRVDGQPLGDRVLQPELKRQRFAAKAKR